MGDHTFRSDSTLWQRDAYCGLGYNTFYIKDGAYEFSAEERWMGTLGCEYGIGAHTVITVGAKFTPEYKNLAERNDMSYLDGLDLAVGVLYVFE